jgi:exosortase
MLLVANPNIVVDLVTYSFDDGTYSHAYLIPFIMLYLVYESVQKGHLVVQFDWRFFLLSLGSLVILLFLGLSQFTYLIRLLLPLTFIFLMLSVIRVHRDIVITGTLLWFVTPIWGVLNSTLQTISTVATESIMKLTDIPVFVEGNLVQIPAGVFEIAGGCSGLRYMITALALSLTYCHIYLNKTKNIILIFALAILGAMITNWIRIVIIIFIGHYSDMQSPLVEDHNSIGWFVFLPFVLLLFYVGGKLEGATPLPDNAEAHGQLPIGNLIGMVLLVIIVSMNSFNVFNGAVLLSYAPIDLEKPPQSESLNGISPQIFDYSLVTEMNKDTNTDRGNAYLFTFDGDNDANKADFYKNDLVPENWDRIEAHVKESEGIIIVRSITGQHARITYQLLSGTQKTGSYSTHKLHRFIGALSMSKESNLYWRFEHCNGECIL